MSKQPNIFSCYPPRKGSCASCIYCFFPEEAERAETAQAPGNAEPAAGPAAENPAGRAVVGKANRAKAVTEYDEKAMIASYRSLYEKAVGRPGALT